MISTIYLVKEYEGELKLDYGEVSEIKWFDLDKLPNNIHDPDIQPIKDIIAYHRKD